MSQDYQNTPLFKDIMNMKKKYIFIFSYSLSFCVLPSLFVICCCWGGQSSQALFHKQTDVAHSRPRTEKQGNGWPNPPHIESLKWNTIFHNESLLIFMHHICSCETRKTNICRLKVPLTVVRHCETALWPPCEEVEVRQRVQLDVIEIHFVIWPPIHLPCTKHNFFLDKRH